MARQRLQRIATLGIALAVVLILATTLTPVAIGDEEGCALGLPCTVGHTAIFAVLGVPIALAFAASDAARRAPRRTLGMVALAIWVFAAATELAQGWVDGREPDLVDWVADMVGAVLGILAGSVLLRVLIEGPRAVRGPGTGTEPATEPPQQLATAAPGGERSGPRRRRSQRRRR